MSKTEGKKKNEKRILDFLVNIYILKSCSCWEFFFKKDIYWDEFLPMHTQHYIDATEDTGIRYHIGIDNVSLFVDATTHLVDRH